MKRVRIILTDVKGSYSALVFKTPEEASVWASGAYDLLPSTDQIPNVQKVTIKEDEFIEAELMGYQYDFKDGKATRLNYFRVVRASDTSNPAGMLINLYEGWVARDEIPIKEHRDSNIICKTISDLEKIFDIPTLFNDIQVDDYDDYY